MNSQGGLSMTISWESHSALLEVSKRSLYDHPNQDLVEVLVRRSCADLGPGEILQQNLALRS